MLIKAFSETALLTPSGEGDSKATAPEKIGVRHVIIVSPARRRNKRAHPGVYDVRMKGQERIICSSRQPFLDGARVMLEEGLAAPQDRLVMRHAGSDADCLSASVATAAKLQWKSDATAEVPCSFLGSHLSVPIWILQGMN